jgi:hypothetical protein
MTGLAYKLNHSKPPLYVRLLLPFVRAKVGIDWDDSDQYQIVVIMGKQLFGVMYVVDQFFIPNSQKRR